LRAVKDGHKLKCVELHLQGANRFGEGQFAWAKGPGEIDLLDTKNPEKESFPQHLLWQETLTVKKETEGGQAFDLMTVVGNASFIDDAQKNELHGDKIMAWFRQTQEGERKGDAVGAGKQELHKLIAHDAVRAVTPEYIIRQTASLTMTFNRSFGRDNHLPNVPIVKVARKDPDNDDQRKIDPPVVIEKKPPQDSKKPAPPIELTANEITISVAMMADKKQLDELIAKGNVFVFQPGDLKGEKRIDIAGHMLVVYGDKDKLAKMELGDTILHGPVITVNQNTNHASIEGNGAMEMPSNKKLDGSETGSKRTRVVVQWNKSMTFNGMLATFNGGVQAWEQGAYSVLKCEMLTAVLDKHVSFKDGQNAKDNAKIDRIICDKNVVIDDAKADEKNQLTQRSYIQAQTLKREEGGVTFLHGPGEIRHLAPGSSEIAFGAPAAPMDVPAKKEWKLTHVKFRDGMNYKTIDNVKTATFFGLNSGVEVHHFPTTKIGDAMNADRPPKDGLYLRCDTLTVESTQLKERVAQTMIAHTNVMFKTDKYLGYADTVKFDDATDMVIMESKNGNPVRLFQITPNGNQPASVNSGKVLYNRRTGEIRSDNVKSITN
jgi:hypothetical protein